MRVKFLVLLAVFCLSFVVVTAFDVPANPSVEPAKQNPVQPTEEAEYIEYEEVEIIKKKKEIDLGQNKTRTEGNNQSNKTAKPRRPCIERLAKQKEDCEKTSTPEWKAVFTFIENEICAWKCDYEEVGGAKKKEKEHKKVINKRKRQKIDEGSGIKRRPGGPGAKECSGEQVIRFQNCKVKLTGLITYGDKTRYFDQKFEKLLNEKRQTDIGGGGGGNMPVRRRRTTTKAPGAA